MPEQHWEHLRLELAPDNMYDIKKQRENSGWIFVDAHPLLNEERIWDGRWVYIFMRPKQLSEIPQV